MAKLSVHFEKEAQEKAARAARKYNEKEILTALRNVGPCDQMPESIKNFLDANQVPRVNAVRLMPFERIMEAEGTFYGEKDEEKVFVCTIKKDGHPFPLMLLYDPEWSKKVAKKGKVEAVRSLLKKRFDLELNPELAGIIRDELPDVIPEEIRVEGSKARFDTLVQSEGSTTYSDVVVAHTLCTNGEKKSVWTLFINEKVVHLEAVRSLLKKRFNLELSPELAGIIRNELPDMLPAEIRFEGSKPRFESLAQRKDSTTYSDVVVAHTMRSKGGEKSAWTIFIKEINVVKHFADHLIEALCLEPQLALRISEAWDHKTYVSVQPQTWNDAKQFGASMVYHGELKEGSTVVDLLQGEIEVVPFEGRLYLDIDDELPSAVIVKGRLNVYVPAKD